MLRAGSAFSFFCLAGLTAIKKYYRYAAFRAYLYDQDSSGYFHRIDSLQKFCKQSGVSPNTLRADLRHFQADGLLAIHGRYIRFKRLQGIQARWYSIYRNWQYDIDMQADKAGFFAALIHRQEIHNHRRKQAHLEAEKIHDPSIRKKYLKAVNQTQAPVGVNQKIFIGTGTLARIFGRSRSTAWRYTSRAEKNGVIRIRRNFAIIGRAATLPQYLEIRQGHRAYGKTVWDNSTGEVRLRLLNDYAL